MGAYNRFITELQPSSVPGNPSEMIFRWSDTYSGLAYQLYLNNALVGATGVDGDKYITASFQDVSATWEILAVDSIDIDVDFSVSSAGTWGFGYEEFGYPAFGSADSSPLDYLDDDAAKKRVEISWTRSSVDLELGSTVNIYSDLSSGTVDTDSPLNSTPIENFPAGETRWGFGLGDFGEQAFGYDGTGIGFGVGDFGMGGFGFDSDSITWESQEFPPGTYKFEARVSDAAGNEDDGSLGATTVTIDSYPVGPASLKVASFAAGALTLTVAAGSNQIPYGG